MDRTYIGAPAAIKLHDSGRNSVLLLHKRGFADAVVWNPAEVSAFLEKAVHAQCHWPCATCSAVPRQRASPQPPRLALRIQAKAASMGDLGAEHWRGFVCVEAAQARSGAVTLAAGQAWRAGVEYEYDHLEES